MYLIILASVRIALELFFTIGSDASLPCVAHGFPAASVSWSQRLKGSDDEESVEVSARKRISSSREELFISKVTLDDEGVYICTASNEFGTVTASGQLTVTGTGLQWINRFEIPLDGYGYFHHR